MFDGDGETYPAIPQFQGTASEVVLTRRAGFRVIPKAPLPPLARSPSPVATGEAGDSGILASPVWAGERSTSSNHTAPFGLCSWEVFPYDLLPAQLHPSGLLLGQVSKWRAQRVDRGVSAARRSISPYSSASAPAAPPQPKQRRNAHADSCPRSARCISFP